MGDKKRSGRRKKRKLCGVALKQTANQDGSLHGSESGEPDSNVSASASKIAGNLDTSVFDNDTTLDLEGFILVDVDILMTFLSSRVKCVDCSADVQCMLDVNNSKGFAFNVLGKCNACENEVDLFQTSRKCGRTEVIRGKNPPYEVNMRMVSYARAIGKGHGALAHFQKLLNSPSVLSFNGYNRLLKLRHKAVETVAKDSMKEAAEEVKQKVGKDCTISVDGTWQRRKRGSHHGVVTAISADTGKCVDVEILSNTCKSCQIWDKRDKNSQAYQMWEAEHKCSSNHTGSANAMEPVGAVRIFSRSENTRSGLRYVNYLGDGDSASFKTVNDSDPYNGIPLKKLECVGHVQKRVGNRLRNLRKDYSGKTLSDGKKMSGAGRLTDKRIDTLQNYFGMAIRQNKGDLMTMQRAIMGSLYHVASTGENPNHSMCPDGDDSWCGFNKDPENYRHKHGIPQCIVDIVEPIYMDLSDPVLLGKCLHGKTQNANECLNKVIWDHCSKEVFVERLTIEEAVFSAVGEFNDGNIAIMETLELLGVKSGEHTMRSAVLSDVKRIHNANRKSSEVGKKRRKKIRAVKKGFTDQNEEAQGTLYEPGGFI